MLIFAPGSVDLGLGRGDIQRLCRKDKGARNAELYTKMVPPNGQEVEPRGRSGR